MCARMIMNVFGEKKNDKNEIKKQVMNENVLKRDIFMEGKP